MHHPTDRITHTTAFVTPVVEHWLEREIAPLLVIEISFHICMGFFFLSMKLLRNKFPFALL